MVIAVVVVPEKCDDVFRRERGLLALMYMMVCKQVMRTSMFGLGVRSGR